MLERGRREYAENPEYFRANALKFHFKNRDKLLSKMKVYGKSEEGKKAAKKHRDANKESIQASTKAWKQTPEGRAAMKRHDATRNDREQANKIPFKKEDITAMLEYFNRKCVYCDSTATEIDHVVPLIAGGKNAIHNMVAACTFCNRSKHTTDALKWFKSQSFFSQERWEKITHWCEIPS